MWGKELLKQVHMEEAHVRVQLQKHSEDRWIDSNRRTQKEVVENHATQPEESKWTSIYSMERK